MPIRHATAAWEGGLKDGQGNVHLGSGTYEGAYSFGSRFEEGAGTNPEELIAAAHAGCFSMALSKMLSDAGYTPQRIDTSADVHLEKQDEGFAITRIVLRTKGRVPNLDAAAFREHAEKAKQGCPVSKTLKPEITLEAELV